MSLRLYVMRHGETEWSLSGQHTGRTDLPLTARGELEAKQLGSRVREIEFSNVFVSPLQRATRTCELAGFGEQGEIESDLIEWDNGEYEGLTTAQIHALRPGWDLFRDGCPAGEMPYQMTERVERFIQSLHNLHGNIALFTHGHFARSLVTRWIGIPLEFGTHFVLGTAALSVLCNQHSPPHLPVIELWNSQEHVPIGVDQGSI